MVNDQRDGIEIPGLAQWSINSFFNKSDFDQNTPLDELLEEGNKVRELEYAAPASIENQ